MNSSYRTNKFSLWERCCECDIENAILECNKCGDALCRNTACCEIFPHYFNTEFIICRECCNAVEKKIKVYVDKKDLILLKNKIARKMKEKFEEKIENLVEIKMQN